MRCSVCSHVWKVEPVEVPATDLLSTKNCLKGLLKPFLWAVFVAGLASSLIINRTPLTAYAPFLINGFKLVGIAIRPNLSKLQVVELNASYVGDTLRLSGELRNTDIWRNHAADLRVTVRDVAGAVVHETVVRPDYDIINAKSGSGFFVQLVLDSGTEVQVTVTPLANQVYR